MGNHDVIRGLSAGSIEFKTVHKVTDEEIVFSKDVFGEDRKPILFTPDKYDPLPFPYNAYVDVGEQDFRGVVDINENDLPEEFVHVADITLMHPTLLTRGLEDGEEVFRTIPTASVFFALDVKGDKGIMLARTIRSNEETARVDLGFAGVEILKAVLSSRKLNREDEGVKRHVDDLKNLIPCISEYLQSYQGLIMGKRIDQSKTEDLTSD